MLTSDKKSTKTIIFEKDLYLFEKVMDTKLTLKLNQEIIEKAKSYAAHNKTSLSKIVEDYLNSLSNDLENNNSF